MSAFLVTYAATRHRASQDLDDTMEGLGAISIGEAVWGIEMETDITGMHKWLKSQLGDDDQAVVIQIKPHLNQSSQNVSKSAAAWLERVLSSSG